MSLWLVDGGLISKVHALSSLERCPEFSWACFVRRSHCTYEEYSQSFFLFFPSSYLDVSELFDAGHLIQKVVLQALKARLKSAPN